MTLRIFRILIVFCFGIISADEPIALWLSWQNAPDSTMVIHWLTTPAFEDDKIAFREAGQQEWILVEGGHTHAPQHNPYLIHAIELIHLKPSTSYEFKIVDKINSFKTAPTDLKEPLTFVVGGDIYHDDINVVEKLNHLIVERDPLFVVLGGDLAYSCKRSTQSKEYCDRWLIWLKSWSQTMVTPQGRMLPMIPAIGNHEVLGKGLQDPSYAEMFYHIFSLPGEKGYRTIKFGDYLSLYLLDTNHTHPVVGEQTKWLKQELSEREGCSFKFAIYHVPAYPSFRSFNTTTCKEIRAHWSPLFEAYNLTAAFEHHDHLYKRSHLIKEGAINPKGVLYLGDGAWGVDKPRQARSNWYIAKTAPIRHVFVVTLQNKQAYFEVLEEGGKIFESFSR